MNETVRLRTMARKSVFTGGRYEGVSVQQLLDLKNYGTLRWYYYNYSMISYTPDILDELGITEDWRIEKPGTCPEKYEQLKEYLVGRLNKKLADVSKSSTSKACSIYNASKCRSRANARERLRVEVNRDRVRYSKGNMQRINHGH